MTSRRLQRGGTLVEAALVLLLFITFLMAVIEFGRAYSIFQTITNAAREGARFAVAPCALSATTSTCTYEGNAGHAPNKTQIQTKVQTYLAALNIRIPDSNILVCSKNITDDCAGASNPTGLNQIGTACTNPQPYCTSINNTDLNFTAVKVIAPYQFILSTFRVFGDSTGTINIRSEARMRDETQN